MTIAERLRTEKRSKVSFDATAFMQIVEKYFQVHKYNRWFNLEVYLKSFSEPTGDYMNNTYDGDTKKSHSKWIGNISVNFNSEECYQNQDTIRIPPEHFKDAVRLLKDEGFSIFRCYDNEFHKIVSISNDEVVKCGINIYVREK